MATAMTQVLTSTNYDYDYDAVQPYFLDGEEEDFYPPPCSQLLLGPGEDIWKKFELLPTPPLSPSRRPPPPPSGVPLSDLLDEGRSPSAAFLQSFIIQDCMWSSSFAAATKLEKVVSLRLALLRSRRDSSTANNNNNNNNNNNATTDGAAAGPVGGAQVNLQDKAATDCVDPSAVFPHSALSGRSGDGAAKEAGSELCLDSPPLSSSDRDSGGGGGGGGDEDEEIDVVTVDRRKVSRRSTSSPLVLKRCHVNVDQHNYAAAPQPSAQSAGKRPRSEFTCASGRRRCWSPRSEGEEEEDDDDDDRRTTHNVLERQRRNELKMSFAALRDEIPAVANNEKTAKVAILKRATSFVGELREEERRLRTVKEELRKRSRATKRRLEQLRTLR
ncbi:transcriptional regulator Myc-B-like isoform X2 [Scophthalmus maximus]|uniref:transcriptional regulator Myc-B-like isoform X2 n=1 Tax=Scophthalmus maximus TaxID=52904 RepID=UPI001FA84EB9|nr:transcriptional regulator Myc-B-like isoform X2 [Scophthalmus maximus]